VRPSESVEEAGRTNSGKLKVRLTHEQINFLAGKLGDTCKQQSRLLFLSIIKRNQDGRRNSSVLETDSIKGRTMP
jgi:hypothetical protein